MTPEARHGLLRIALFAIGVVFVLGVPVLMTLTENWSWSPPHYEYEQMIMGIYATLGVFLILAARAPMAYWSVIWFTVWSSVVHGGIMFVQALVDPAERSNLVGDVPALFLVAIVLAVLMPKGERAGQQERAAARSA